MKDYNCGYIRGTFFGILLDFSIGVLIMEHLK